MKLQLAKIYRGDTFFGYGVAVDGVLVEQQINTNIISSANELPIINVQFTLRAEQVEDPITITLE
ncbi:hypothetical protein [Serratia fonticola]|jgi:hypothetical protein|uniref:hypothetical protein n=1 Tax=Serratia fonticola TaxID=47917 RepID=UPI00192CF476|nr:hypothetical protein [Serratia fonticola]MBL5825414.1 hypothetical protein [Serratia fonticola]